MSNANNWQVRMAAGLVGAAGWWDCDRERQQHAAQLSGLLRSSRAALSTLCAARRLVSRPRPLGARRLCRGCRPGAAARHRPGGAARRRRGGGEAAAAAAACVEGARLLCLKPAAAPALLLRRPPAQAVLGVGWAVMAFLMALHEKHEPQVSPVHCLSVRCCALAKRGTARAQQAQQATRLTPLCCHTLASPQDRI